eukprot:Filipodium_phascolosomae@DN1230_c0_g1_i1.p1
MAGDSVSLYTCNVFFVLMRLTVLYLICILACAFVHISKSHELKLRKGQGVTASSHTQLSAKNNLNQGFQEKSLLATRSGLFGFGKKRRRSSRGGSRGSSGGGFFSKLKRGFSKVASKGRRLISRGRGLARGARGLMSQYGGGRDRYSRLDDEFPEDEEDDYYDDEQEEDRRDPYDPYGDEEGDFRN